MPIQQLDVQDLTSWVQTRLDLGQTPILLDVRENWEYETARIEISGVTTVHIPMPDLVQRFHELAPQAPIAVLCHHGVRSQQVAQFLDRQGYETYNISGGIDAWSAEVDASVPCY